jgi:protein involved in polysaccharide export with SLBB domain
MSTLTRRIAAAAALAAVCAPLAACDSIASLTDSRPAAPAPTIARTTPTIRLQPGDKVRVVVFDEDRISGEYEVDSSGAISLPLAGTVPASGLTKPELEASITRKLREKQLLNNPMVTVDISTLRPFYVLGEVEKPGEYPYHLGLNVMSAVAMAGGNTFRASKGHVQIQRAGETSFKEVPFTPDVPIFPGDLINIPERYF